MNEEHKYIFIITKRVSVMINEAPSQALANPRICLVEAGLILQRMEILGKSQTILIEIRSVVSAQYFSLVQELSVVTSVEPAIGLLHCGFVWHSEDMSLADIFIVMAW